jgi:hypothetical protein
MKKYDEDIMDYYRRNFCSDIDKIMWDMLVEMYKMGYEDGYTDGSEEGYAHGFDDGFDEG